MLKMIMQVYVLKCTLGFPRKMLRNTVMKEEHKKLLYLSSWRQMTKEVYDNCLPKITNAHLIESLFQNLKLGYLQHSLHASALSNLRPSGTLAMYNSTDKKNTKQSAVGKAPMTASQSPHSPIFLPPE